MRNLIIFENNFFPSIGFSIETSMPLLNSKGSQVILLCSEIFPRDPPVYIHGCIANFDGASQDYAKK